MKTKHEDNWTDGITEGMSYTRKDDGSKWIVRRVSKDELIVLACVKFAGAHRIESAKQFNEVFSK